MRVADYYKGQVEYSLSALDGGARHGLERDLQLFIVWEKGRHADADVLQSIGSSFDILAVCTVQWSSEHSSLNFKRFYKHINAGRVRGKAEEVGAGEFLCVVLEDRNPAYRYRQTVSGNVELVNTNLLTLKRRVREQCGGYFVHSSGSPEEFFEQAILLFGPQRLQEIVDRQWVNTRRHLEEDLAGSAGWEGFAELFSVLRYCSNYVVLRNFEFLPDQFFENDKDVDVLCARVADFAMAANATIVSSSKGVTKLQVRIAGREVPFDLRCVGDDYFDMRWQCDLLDRRQADEFGIFQPRADDYFFSLFYHAVLQKPAVKPAYIERLGMLAQRLELDFFEPQILDDAKRCARLIEGFLRASGYAYVKPQDVEVFQNHQVIRHIDVKVGGGNKTRLLNLMRLLFPASIRRFIPVGLKRFVLGRVQ